MVCICLGVKHCICCKEVKIIKTYGLTCPGAAQGARFAKWRSVISIPSGPSNLALQDCAYGLARYAAISQVSNEPPARGLFHVQSREECIICMGSSL